MTNSSIVVILATIPYLAKNTGPDWLPVSAAQGRQFAYWGQLVLLLMAVVLFMGSAYAIVSGSYSAGAYMLIAGIVDLILYAMMSSTVFAPLDQGRFREASDRLLIWGVLGLLFSVLGGLVLLAAYVKLQDVFQPQYQQYPPGQYYDMPHYQQPQYYSAPSPHQFPSKVDDISEVIDETASEKSIYESKAEPEPQPSHKSEMTKCKNCQVQYPSFMMNCPNCGAPRN
ncbi:MAG: hypothetical protein GX369_05610 [Euryarchaeota archaeon]|nr:hypothetical protein [Euryarchaeota archaeon]